VKTSKYNFFLPYEADENKLIAYNSFSNALALMDKSKHGKLHQFTENGTAIDDEELIGQLKQGRFLIDEDNELEHLRLRMLKSRYNTGFLGLTIAPTADCQFRCPYCYEKDAIKPDYMTEEVEEAIIKFAEGHMKTIGALSISWYGGEPLMNLESIKRLSDKFITMCEENDVNYNASMVTNGYLLTRETVQLLNELKIMSLQVTLDGCEEVHNKRRPHVDGSGTFSTIINNLTESKDILPRVSLRINVDKENVDAINQVREILEERGLLEKVKPYLGQVTVEEDSPEKSSCFDTCGFSKETFNYFRQNSTDETYMNHYPRTVRNVCGADCANAHVITADGRLYKCWKDVGNHSRCVGSLVEKVKADESVYLNYMLYDPTVDSNCSECKLLPVCMGGCPVKRLETEEKCSIYKYALDDFLGVIAKRLKLQKDLKFG